MNKCLKCKRQTEPGEPMGKFRVMEPLDPKGSRIVSEKLVCMFCNGEKWLK